MNIFFYIILFIFWTLFGSFASVIIYRLKSNEKWIISWRSHCAKCNRVLWILELIPIISWIINKWKCKYCFEKISKIYPLLEICMGIIFFLIWYFLINIDIILIWNLKEIIKLIFWLLMGFITVIYTFYDIMFLEIHEWVLLFGIWILLFILSIQTIFPDFHIVNTISNNITNINIWIISIIISTIIIWLLYIILIKELSEIYDVLIILSIIISLYIFKSYFWINLSQIPIINWIIWALWIFIFFFLQILISKWKWIWWGDLRIAIMMGLILWTSWSFMWIMISYFVWSIVWIWYIIYYKLTKWWKSKCDTQIPFWPFLAIWSFVCVFFGNEILKLAEIYIF